MKFAITTSDRYLGVFDAFVAAGWKPLKLFTVPMKGELTNQQAAMDYAIQRGAAVQLSRLMPHDLEELQRQGCEALIVAGYNWKIPDWRPYLKYAVNIHSSPLPEGRGSYPAIRAILENRISWAVTCHKLTTEFDDGDILAVENFPLQLDECHESMDLKIQMAAKRLATRVASQFVELWDQAQPQEGGSYWPKAALKDSVIDFQKPVETIRRHIRAFGANGSMAFVGGMWLILKRAVGWSEQHNHIPGSVVHIYNRSMVVAAPDGYIGLLEIDIASPILVAELRKSLPITLA